MKFLSILLAPLFVASYVSAHGRVDATAASGQTFTINRGEDTPNDNTPIRRASSQDPIIEFGNNTLTCGTGANPAPFSMAVNPGETVQIYWRDFAGGKWAHNKGPLITYLADCGGPCPKFQHNSNTPFFKIHQVGKKPGTKNWFQEDLGEGPYGQPTSFQIPDNLAPGEYIARTEVIAFHRLDQDGKTEFYPGCVQLKVGGTQTGHFDPKYSVNFPGEYRESDKGFTLDEVNLFDTYEFPGGPIAQLVEGGSSSDDPSPPGGLSDPPSNATSISTSRKPPSTSTPKSQSMSTRKPSLSISTGPSGNVNANSPSTSLPPLSFRTETKSPTPTPTDGYNNRRQLGHIMRRRAEI